MTDLPAAAITIAAEAMAVELPKLFPWIRATQSQERINASAFDVAVRALEAAAPLIAAAEHDRIIKLTLFHAEQLSGGAMDYEASLFRDFAGLLREEAP